MGDNDAMSRAIELEREEILRASAEARRAVSGDFDWELKKLQHIIESTRTLCDLVDKAYRATEVEVFSTEHFHCPEDGDPRAVLKPWLPQL